MSVSSNNNQPPQHPTSLFWQVWEIVWWSGHALLALHVLRSMVER